MLGAWNHTRSAAREMEGNIESGGQGFPLQLLAYLLDVSIYNFSGLTWHADGVVMSFGFLAFRFGLWLCALCSCIGLEATYISEVLTYSSLEFEWIE